MDNRDALIGNILRKYRMEDGRSIQYVADKIGKTKSAVAYWENGARSINMSDVLDIVTKMGYDRERFVKDIMDIL